MAEATNQKWAGDISYVWTSEGWLYLAVILDLHSRRIIGWSFDETMTVELIQQALDMALNQRQVSPGLVVHSDRGVQYRAQKTLIN